MVGLHTAAPGALPLAGVSVSCYCANTSAPPQQLRRAGVSPLTVLQVTSVATRLGLF